MSNYLQEKINNSFTYIPLRATSPYSLLQGAVTMDKISQNCLDYNIPAVAIVDNNNLFGALEFCEHMSHKGIQPIIGCNLNIKSEKHRGSLVLLCSRREGYKNLIRLSSEIYINDHGEEIIDFSRILELNEGLICLSGGQNGLINNLLVNNQKKDALKIIDKISNTFKDRFYLESDPHRFFEGMLIASEVVGIDKIYIYLRDEYAAVRDLMAVELEKITNKYKNSIPEIELRRGAGAYICGEESAMIESIEGKKGMPRLRPPFVAQVGLFGRPTLEHNMETLYWVRDISEKGAGWFSSHGRNGRKGLRSFSVSGRVNKPGVHLAPAGITVKELIDEYAGGMIEGHQFHAYFPGGASGGILPASMNNIPLDFDTLNEYDCFIGSAAIIILSDQDAVTQAASTTMSFFEHESCGKCTPCRVGTSKATKLMSQDKWDVKLLNDLAEVMSDSSICGLGQAASNPLKSVIKYFPEEIKK